MASTRMVTGSSANARRRAAIACGAVLSLFASTSHAGHAEECASTAEQASDQKDAGKLRESLPLYEMCAADNCPSVVRDDCRKALADLRANGPKLVVHVRDRSGNDAAAAVIEIDGKIISADDRTRGLLVDPGSHVVRASLSPYAPDQKMVIVAAADHDRVVDLVVGKNVDVEPPPTKSESAPNHTASFITGGIGVVAVAAFAVLGTWTYVGFKNEESSCGNACNPSDVDSLKTRAHVADVVLAVGVVALAASAVLWITAPKKSSTQTAMLRW